MAISYRPEVDGLRCVAVMLVILHHLGIPGFDGGFVGVDVFFVISGYLITSIILSEVARGGFSFGRFYQRRVIRLAPAYFLVLVVTSIVAGFVMLPSELQQYSRSAIYSTFFAANFFMWDTVGGYFGAGADTTPLLHLWSLAVEEQFYLFWPVSLLLLYRLFRSKVLMFSVMAIAFLLALGVSEYGALHYRAAAYYLMPTRAFELLIGALLVAFPTVRLSAVPRIGALILSVSGICLIVYSSLFFSKGIWFPGLNALFPCLGTALVILFTHSDTPIVGSMLTNRLVVGVGKVSYPAYLWHWPIIAFLNIYLIDITPWLAIGVISLTMLLSLLTYRFVETPARKFRSHKNGVVISGGFALPAVLLTAIAVVAVKNNGFPARFDEALNAKAEAVMTYANDVRGRCNQGPVRAPLSEDECVLGVDDGKVDLLLVGDSHANHFSGMIDVLAKNAGLRGYDVTQSNTVFLVGLEYYYKQSDEVVHNANFRARNDYIENELLPRAYPYVVLGANYVGHLKGMFARDSGGPERDSEQVFVDGLYETVEKIIGYGSTPVLIKGNPTYDHDISRCTQNNARFGKAATCKMDRADFDRKFHDWNRIVDELKARFDSLVVIDPASIMCDKEFCYSELKEVPLYKDGGHLNYKGSELIGELYIEGYGNPFEKRLVVQ